MKKILFCGFMFLVLVFAARGLLEVSTAEEKSLAIRSVPCDRSAPNSRDGSFSPDGNRILFSSTRNGDSDIFVMDSDGKNVRRLIKTAGADHYPFFTPDGSKITFDSYGNNSAVIYIANADGTNIKPLTKLGEFNADPNVSPDGRRIAFYSKRDGVDQIYSMNIDGSDQRRITNTQTRETTPVYSPDGSKILFISNRDGNGELYVMSSDGSGVRRLTNSPLSDRVARWSPDGNTIAFYSRPTGIPSGASWPQAEIELINADGTGRKKVTSDSYPDQGPVFSPDGRKILFTSCRTGNLEVYLMNRDGSEKTRLTYSR